MMSKVKVTVVALFAVVALSAVVASTASASWFVGGSELKTAAPLATTAKVDKDAVLRLPTLNIRILCGGGLLRGLAPEINGPGNTGKAKSLTFEGCKVSEPENSTCELTEQPKTEITTVPILAVAALGATSPDVHVTFTPQTKTQFTELPFKESNTCALAGEQPVKGSVKVNAPSGQSEEVAQIIEGMGSVENNSLEVGSGNKAFLEGGSALLRLASGSKWSFK